MKVFYMRLLNIIGPIFQCKEDAGKSLRLSFTNISFILRVITKTCRNPKSSTKKWERELRGRV